MINQWGIDGQGGKDGEREGQAKEVKMVMKSASMLGVSLLGLTTCCCLVAAFLPLRHSIISRKLSLHCHAATTTRLKDRKSDESDREIDFEMISQRDWSSNIPNDIGLEIIRGSEDDISDKIWGDIEGGAPNQWIVMKNVSYLGAFSICKSRSRYPI